MSDKPPHDPVGSLLAKAVAGASSALDSWSQHGRDIGTSRWFSGNLTVEMNQAGLVVWKCPNDGCNGEMEDTGMMWTTGDPGYHHECSMCGFTAAIKGAVFSPRDDK